eukprot:362321-Chlamydomonas_euryale.AAC.10
MGLGCRDAPIRKTHASSPTPRTHLGDFGGAAHAGNAVAHLLGPSCHLRVAAAERVRLQGAVRVRCGGKAEGSKAEGCARPKRLERKLRGRVALWRGVRQGGDLVHMRAMSMPHIRRAHAMHMPHIRRHANGPHACALDLHGRPRCESQTRRSLPHFLSSGRTIALSQPPTAAQACRRLSRQTAAPACRPDLNACMHVRLRRHHRLSHTERSAPERMPAAAARPALRPCTTVALKPGEPPALLPGAPPPRSGAFLAATMDTSAPIAARLCLRFLLAGGCALGRAVALTRRGAVALCVSQTPARAIFCP